MNDFIAGPASDTREGGPGPGGGGSPPTVLIAALGAAVLIAATLVGLLLSSGGGDAGTSGGLGIDGAGPAATTAAGDEARVLLTVQVDGGGSGRVTIEPRAISCTDTCEHAFALGARVSLSADAEAGSRFEGWSESCKGSGRCSLVMDRPREVTVTFESTPAAASQCSDGRDNDGDRLVDEADPGCDSDATEAPDNRPAQVSDCSDGRDNDGDGLVDAAQDPECANGGSEAGSVTPTTTTAPTPQPQSECRDGRDNDGDGLVDRPADPGCDADGTEAG